MPNDTKQEFFASSLPILRVLILSLTWILAFSVRLFAVIRYESVIHEFDPYFNFRTTKYLAKEGFYEWWNWFDSASWYPLGRVIGQTLYPGLMTTAFLLHQLLHALGLQVDIRDVCVFTAPAFSGLTAIAAYLLTKECTGKSNAALLASIFVALSPAYMSRSVAGSFDNEAVAIFALVFSFYAYVRAVNRGTIPSAILACFAYFYMAASWGGYVFVTNMVAIHCLTLLVLGKLTLQHYVVYSVFYIIGTLFCLNIPFVNFQAITSSEHLSSHAVFFILQVVIVGNSLQEYLPVVSRKKIVRWALSGASGSVVVVFLALTLTGKTKWAGRSLTLLDPTYASRFIPIIASVSEHQPPTWTNFIFDLNLCAFFAPAGLWLIFLAPTASSIFVGLYGLLAVYFSCVMVRLMLVLCPAACILAAVALSYVISAVMPRVEEMSSRSIMTNKSPPSASPSNDHVGGELTAPSTQGKSKLPTLKHADQSDPTYSKTAVGAVTVLVLLFLTIGYVKHGVFAAAVAYSHPSIVFSSRLRDGTRIMFDDFREAYYWMRQNTHKDARLMSWWDYGYQSAAMADRTVIVDNNTWNTTHIATVGYAFASPEEVAYPVILKLDVDYVFVVFGGVTRFSSDDINKFLWMIRIANGVYPEVKEEDYYSDRMYRVGEGASPAMRNSLLYRLSYHRFDEGPTKGYDTVREAQIPKIPPLKHFKEVFTSENYIVRVFEVQRPNSLRASTTAQSIDRL